MRGIKTSHYPILLTCSGAMSLGFQYVKYGLHALQRHEQPP